MLVEPPIVCGPAHYLLESSMKENLMKLAAQKSSAAQKALREHRITDAWLLGVEAQCLELQAASIE